MRDNESYHHGDLKNALIEAGITILAQEGLKGLSLRKVAQQAGVSHAAPYAHFANKEALIAAISTVGYQRLYKKMQQAAQQHQEAPLQQLIEVGWAYMEFSQEAPEHFKITFSSMLEREKDYPEFVSISKKAFKLVVEIVERCQTAGILRPGPAGMLAVSIWSMVHGLINLLLEGQVSHTMLEEFPPREMLLFSLNQVTIPNILPGKA